MKSSFKNKSEIDQKKIQNKSDENDEKSDLTGDYGNVALLLLLYLMQGFPIGIIFAVPMILQSRDISLKEQAIFSIASYPFAVKILWAPIVDSVYVKSWGRRKSWLIPVQLLIGTFMLFMSLHVDTWLGTEKSIGKGEPKDPEVLILTIMFFILFFLTATQDIVVDGWAIGMLKPRNVGYASSCQSIGQVIGCTISYVVLLILNSKDFCNEFIFVEPRDEGLITFSVFLQFCGVLFISVTILISIFKRENMELQEKLEDHPDYGVKKSYPILWRIMKLKPVIKLSILLLTVRMCFAACDGIAELKLVEYKISNDKITIALMGKALARVVGPILVGKWTIGKFPMKVFLLGFPFRMLMIVMMTVFLYYTPLMIEDGISNSYFWGLFSIIFLYEIPLVILTVAETAFFAKVTDPLLGGTYMTLLTTISNLGLYGFKTVFMWVINMMTWKSCSFVENHNSTSQIYEAADFNSSTSSSTDLNFFDAATPSTDLNFHSLSPFCHEKSSSNQCTLNGGSCQTNFDGFFIANAAGVVFAFFWFYFGRKVIVKLQNLPIQKWHVLSNLVEKPENIS